MTQLQTSRDYLAEVKTAVNEYLDTHDPYVGSEAAADLIRQWAGSGLLEGWLLARAQGILTEYIRSEKASRASRKPREEGRAVFKEYIEEFEDSLAIDGPDAAREKTGWFFRQMDVTENGRRVQKTLCTLNARQVCEAAGGYQRRRDENAFYAAKLEAIQRRVAAVGPDATVGDVYSESQINAMFERGDR